MAKRSATTPFQLLVDAHLRVISQLKKLQETSAQLRCGAHKKYPAEEMRKTLSRLERLTIPHMRLEEEVLYPYLETRIPRLAGPIQILQMEHDDFRKRIGILKGFLSAGKEAGVSSFDSWHAGVEQACLYIVTLLRNHVFQEDEILFKKARGILTTDESKTLSAKISSAKRQIRFK